MSSAPAWTYTEARALENEQHEARVGRTFGPGA